MALTVQASTDFAQKAYELMTFYALRPELYHDAVADVRPSNQSQPGSSVQFTITADLALATTPLNEQTDVTRWCCPTPPCWSPCSSTATP